MNTLPPLLRDRRNLVTLFLALRLTLLVIYQPMIVSGIERGLTTFGDFQTYHAFAALSAQGKLPYRDFWYEFPPAFPLISLAAYSVAPEFGTYALLLGLLMTAADLANLLLVVRIGRRIHRDETGIALGWVYALLAAPVALAWWTFEPLVTLAVLFGIANLIERKPIRAAASTAFGTLLKLWPLALSAVAVRFLPVRDAIHFIGVALVSVIIGVAIWYVAAGGSRYFVPSLAAQFNKASYETVWALLDGNYKTGNFGPVADRFDPAKAYELQGNPATVPALPRLLVFGAIGAFIYARVRRFDARGMVAFATLTILLFFLWAQGWSPQWQTTLLPLILLCFPTRTGVLVAVALSFLSFVEYPLLFARTGDTGGVIAGAQLPVFTMLILARTALLAGLCFGLYRELRQVANDR